MKKLISRLMVALMAGAFTFAASANAERYDSYAAQGTITYNGSELTPSSGTGWLRDAIVLGEEGYNQTSLGGFKYEGATIRAKSSGVVHHASGGTYPHFWCDMKYDVRGCTVIGASQYNDAKKIPYDSWIPAIYVTNHSGNASMRVTVVADEKTRLSKFEFFPETGAQIVCDRPVPIIRAEPGTTNACDWANGVTDYGVAWYYADKNSPAHEPVFKNDDLYYYSEVKPVSLKGAAYNIFGIKTADYDYTVPHTSFVVMDNGKATPEWDGHEYYACTNNYYGTTKKFQIAYRAHPTKGVYTTDPNYYFPDGTTTRTNSIDTTQYGYVNDTDTFKTFSTCYIPAEKVTETPVPLIPVISLDAPNATWTINGILVKEKENKSWVLSNGTYTVTYKADPGYCFGDAKTVKTVDLITTNCASAYVVSDQKPGDPVTAPTVITIDANAVADGTNTFKTLDAAFQAPLTQCATNLVLKGGIVSLSADAPAYPATNNLQVITGSGYLLIDEYHKNAKGENDAMALAAALQALVAEGSDVKVRTAARTVNEGDMVLSEDLAAFESITLKDPSIAGDVELIAPTKTITGTLTWDVSKDVALLHDFDSITNEVTKYAIEVGSVTVTPGVTNKTLATKASTLSAETFTFITNNVDYASLTVGQGGDVVCNGMVYTLAMTNGTDLVLTMDGDYVSNTLATVTAMAEVAAAKVASMRFLQADKDLAYTQIWEYYYADTTGKVCTAKNTDDVATEVSVFAKNLADLLEYAKKNYEDLMPTNITIDATLESPDGKNTFNTLDAAFTAVSTSCATNLVLTDRFTTLSENVPVDKSPDPATNYLQAINFQGVADAGYLLIDENHKNAKGENDAMALAAALQALVAEDAPIKVRTAAQTVNAGDMVLTEDLAAFGSITLADPTIAGDVELIAPTSTITGTLTWDVSGDVALLHDFDSISNEVTTYAVDVGAVTPSAGVATYTLATGAGALSAQTFTFATNATDYASLTVGSESNVVYNGMVYTLAMTNGTDLVLTMDGDFVPGQLAAVDTLIADAITDLYAMGLSEEEVSYSTNTLATISSTAKAAIGAAKNKAAVAEALAAEADAIDAALETAQKLANAPVRVAGTPYDTVAEAVAAANAGDTVTLRKDVETDTTISIDKALTLDLGTNTLSAAEGLLALDVTNATVWVTGVEGAAIASAHVAQPGAVNCEDNTSVQAPEDYDWVAVPGGDYYTLAQKPEPFTGNVTISTNLEATASWAMTLASNAVVTIDMLAGTDTLAAITNNLVAIQGTGTIILNAKDTEYRNLLRDLAKGSDVTIDCLTIEPAPDIEEAVTNLTATITADKEDSTAAKTIVGQMAADNGDAELVAETGLTKDIVVQAGVIAKKSVTLVNKSTCALTVPVAKGASIVIESHGDFTSAAEAEEDLYITNASPSTLIGTYTAGGNIYLAGEQGALSNVTLEAKLALTLTGTNIVSGPVTLNALGNTIVTGSTLLFSIAGGNTTLCLDSDGALWRSRSMVTGVIIDDATPSGTYLLASTATEAAKKTFGLYKNGAKLRDLPAVNTNNLAIVDGVACGLTLDDNGELKAVVKIVADYTTSISNAAAAACAEILAMPRLTDAEKATATNAVMTFCDNYVAEVLAAPDTDTAEEAVAEAAQLIALRCADAQKLGDNKPYSITIDATAEENGTNVFNTLDAAFKSVDTQFATNLVVKGTAGLSADVLAAPSTNNLAVISGEGTIVIDENHVDANGDNDAEALAAFFNAIAGAGVTVTTAPATKTLTDATPAGEVLAAQSITLNGTTTIGTNVLFTAPSVANNGTLAWNLKGDNHEATLGGFDTIAEGTGAKYALELDADQANTAGGTITNYVLATEALSATNLTFTLTGPSPFGTRSLTVGEENTLYLDAKAYSLVVDEAGNLVFNVAWGKFAITFNAMGGAHANGNECVTNDCYVNKGYELPTVTREGYAFAGWFTNWQSSATEALAEGDALYVLAAHALYAHWTSTAPAPTGGLLALADLEGDAPVTAIAKGAYAKNTSLKTLVTPLYLTSIGDYAFSGDTKLSSVTITAARSYDDLAPVSVSIGRNAFAGCSALASVRLAGEVSSIGASAFQNCSSLKKIVFMGDAAITYGSSAFYRCGYQNGSVPFKLYMSAEFQANNAALIAQMKAWNTTAQIVEKVDVAPIEGGEISIADLDLANLTANRQLAVVVQTGVNGTPDPDDVEIEYATSLTGTWSALEATKTAYPDGTVMLEVTVPEGSSLYLKAVVAE